MNRSEVRAFLEAGVNELTPALEFGAGLITDFNSIRSHTYPSAWQVTASVNVEAEFSAPIASWDIQLVIGQKDRMDSSPQEYEAILDECDTIAQKLIYQYRNIVSGYKLTTMNGITREPFVKKHADCLSGVILSFTLVSPDQTDVC